MFHPNSEAGCSECEEAGLVLVEEPEEEEEEEDEEARALRMILPAKKARTSDVQDLQKFEMPQMIVEIGNDRKGDVGIAKNLLTVAKECGATVGKFHKRCPKELLNPEQAPREFLELSLDDHKELQRHCQEIGLEYSCSTWDKTSAEEIASLNPKLISVAAPMNTHVEMMEYLRDRYAGEVHISTGMTMKEEVEKIVSFWEQGRGDAKNRVVLYMHRTRGPFKDVCLLEIRWLQSTYAHRVKAIGFSGHHLGIAVDIAAYTLGASWFDRRFVSQGCGSEDDAFSVEPCGLRKLICGLRLAAYQCMKYKSEEI